MRFFRILAIIVFFLLNIYLILPAPKDFPALPDSLKSIEPGDTVQIPGVSAYYTDVSRQQTVDFYFKYFSKSPFLGLPLITYKLNHPPERIREVLRETQQSTYVEELVHPFRESVFISGFEWNNDPFTPPKSRPKNILLVDGRVYQFKVTLFYQESKIWYRLLIFWFSCFACWLIYKVYKEIWEEWQKKK